MDTVEQAKNETTEAILKGWQKAKMIAESLQVGEKFHGATDWAKYFYKVDSFEFLSFEATYYSIVSKMDICVDSNGIITKISK